MRFIIVLLFFIWSSIKVFGQTFSNRTIFKETFDTQNRNWTFRDINQSFYDARIINGKYRVYLPESQQRGFTWVKYPINLSNNFNSSNNISFEFDADVSEADDWFRFGLMFDLHNVVPKSCPGGDFYLLGFSSNKSEDSIQTQFRQATNCNRDWTILSDGLNVKKQGNNHFEIRKLDKHWMIYINSSLVMELDFNSNISLDKLYFENGKYYFDNFSLVSKAFVVNSNPVTSNPNITPKIWALCVGIEDYSIYPGYPQSVNNLNYTVDDAQEYYNFLRSTKGGQLPANQIKLLTNRNATAENILGSASELFNNADENDLIILFLSGHGGKGIFCSSNGPLEYENLNRILNQSRARRKLNIVDACHSGSWNNKKNVYAPNGRNLTPQEALDLFYTELRKSGEGITYLLAARYDEVSYEFPELKHGAFTYFLLKGLGCAAQEDENPIINLQELFNYLNKTVTQAHVGKFDIDGTPFAQQHPVIKGKDPSMPISVCVNQ